MSEPRTSVVIPCYNVDHYLRAALDSVSNQTTPVREIVLVDDGSKVPLLAPTDWQGPPLRLIRTENRGLAAARNLGTDHATGEFVAYLDADNAWHPDKIARQEKALDSDADAVAAFTRCVQAPGFYGFGPYPPQHVSERELPLVLWYNCACGTPSGLGAHWRVPSLSSGGRSRWCSAFARPSGVPTGFCVD